MTEAPSFSALLRSTLSTTLCSTNGDAWTLSSLLDGSTVDILSAFFSYRSSEHCCHWGCCVCSTCRIVSRLWLQPAPCKKPPTNRVGSRLPRGVCVGGLGNSSRSHYTWTLATLCACEQQLTTICRQQHGAEVRTLITNICLLQGSWWDNWMLLSSKHSWLLHVPTTRELSVCVLCERVYVCVCL